MEALRLIRVTQPEMIHSGKCHESQLLEETKPHRGKTPVLEVGRALAIFDGTSTGGTQGVAGSHHGIKLIVQCW